MTHKDQIISDLYHALDKLLDNHPEGDPVAIEANEVIIKHMDSIAQIILGEA